MKLRALTKLIMGIMITKIGTKMFWVNKPEFTLKGWIDVASGFNVLLKNQMIWRFYLYDTLFESSIAFKFKFIDYCKIM